MMAQWSNFASCLDQDLMIKVRLFVTNVKSNSSSIENVEGVLGIELGWQLLGIELGMCGQLSLLVTVMQLIPNVEQLSMIS